jgi:hypothetical protein
LSHKNLPFYGETEGRQGGNLKARFALTAHAKRPNTTAKPFGGAEGNAQRSRIQRIFFAGLDFRFLKLPLTPQS